MNSSLKKRDVTLDIIRIIAVFLVISVHSIYKFGFYDNTVYGKRFVIACIMRHFFMACVPLFLMLTGYLMNRKELSRSYFKGLLRILIVYVLASLASIPVHILKGEAYPFKRIFLHLIGFKLAPYSWYIEMYIGLFFLIPFLNHLYHGCRSHKEKKFLMAVLVIFTSIPSCSNIFNMEEAYWWMNPLQHLGTQRLIPGYWTILFPITYYLIGCYLSEYRPHLSRKTSRILIFLLILHSIAGGLFNYFINAVNELHFQWDTWQDWGSILNLITTVLIFVLCLQINTEHWHEKTINFLHYLSDLTLGIYLMSWNFDNLFYPMLNSQFTDGKMHIEFYLPMSISVFICSAFCAVIINWLTVRIMGWIQKKQDAKFPVP